MARATSGETASRGTREPASLESRPAIRHYRDFARVPGRYGWSDGHISGNEAVPPEERYSMGDVNPVASRGEVGLLPPLLSTGHTAQFRAGHARKKRLRKRPAHRLISPARRGSAVRGDASPARGRVWGSSARSSGPTGNAAPVGASSGSSNSRGNTPLVGGPSARPAAPPVGSETAGPALGTSMGPASTGMALRRTSSLPGT